MTKHERQTRTPRMSTRGANHDRATEAGSGWDAMIASTPQRTLGNQALARRADAAPIAQTKLTVGPAVDSYEQEADHVAAQVVSNLQAQRATVQREGAQNEPLQAQRVAISSLQHVPAVESGPADALQREQDEDELQAKRDPGGGAMGGQVSEDLERSIRSQRGGGAPMAQETQGAMESSFGADFSGVRVHQGATADALNRSLSARAFTSGSDIFFRSGEYDPGTAKGESLLAHELTHVVQQGAASQKG